MRARDEEGHTPGREKRARQETSPLEEARARRAHKRKVGEAGGAEATAPPSMRESTGDGAGMPEKMDVT